MGNKMSKFSKISFVHYIVAFLLIILIFPLLSSAADIDDIRRDLENQIKQKQE